MQREPRSLCPATFCKAAAGHLRRDVGAGAVQLLFRFPQFYLYLCAPLQACACSALYNFIINKIVLVTQKYNYKIICIVENFKNIELCKNKITYNRVAS